MLARHIRRRVPAVDVDAKAHAAGTRLGVHLGEGRLASLEAGERIIVAEVVPGEDVGRCARRTRGTHARAQRRVA